MNDIKIRRSRRAFPKFGPLHPPPFVIAIGLVVALLAGAFGPVSTILVAVGGMVGFLWSVLLATSARLFAKRGQYERALWWVIVTLLAFAVFGLRCFLLR
jgi:hypothetical protein